MSKLINKFGPVIGSTVRYCLILQLSLMANSAYAGQWNLHIGGTGSATGSKAPIPWEAPKLDETNKISFKAFSSGAVSAIGVNAPVTAAATITATLTGTWVPSTNATDDPAPPSVVVYESSTAHAEHQTTSGGIVGPKIAGTVDNGTNDNDHATPAELGTMVGHVYATETGSTFTMPINLSASATAPGGSDGPDPNNPQMIIKGSCTASASVGPVTLSIHAQPYNFHITVAHADWDGKSSPPGSYPGGIYFQYDWSSTTGNKADLTTCYAHERVSYPGGINPYVPAAPFVASLDNPTVLPAPGTTYTNSMAITGGQDEHYVLSTSTPYSTSSFTAAQRYEFDDTETGETNILIPGPDSSPSIVRSVDVRIPYVGWWYSCTKSGITGWLKLP